jgi:hypothetical protein
MSIEGRPIGVGGEAGMRPRAAMWARWTDAVRPGRLVPIILAIYLIPALLVVLAVGGIGLLVLAVARTITSVLHGREVRPRSPVRPESS